MHLSSTWASQLPTYSWPAVPARPHRTNCVMAPKNAFPSKRDSWSAVPFASSTGAVPLRQFHCGRNDEFKLCLMHPVFLSKQLIPNHRTCLNSIWWYALQTRAWCRGAFQLVGSYATSSWERVFGPATAWSGWQHRLCLSLSKPLTLFPLPVSQFRFPGFPCPGFRSSKISCCTTKPILLVILTKAVPKEGSFQSADSRETSIFYFLQAFSFIANPVYEDPSSVALLSTVLQNSCQSRHFWWTKLDRGSSDTVLFMWMMLSLLIKNTLLIKLPKQPFLPLFSLRTGTSLPWKINRTREKNPKILASFNGLKWLFRFSTKSLQSGL